MGIFYFPQSRQCHSAKTTDIWPPFTPRRFNAMARLVKNQQCRHQKHPTSLYSLCLHLLNIR